MIDENTLSMLQPDDVRHGWSAFRDRLAELSEAQGDGWIPEDVYRDIMNGVAYLWATEDFSGFVVLVIQVSHAGRELFVWAADNQSDDVAEVYWEQLKVIAQDNTCTRVSFDSARRWDRKIPSLQVRYRYFEDV